MNLLGIDWGEKRIGLAFADELGLAYPLPAAIARSQKMRLQQIEQLIEDRKIDAIVVGYPINMNGSVGFKAQQVDAFIKLLEGRFRLPVHRIDERLSSHAVEQGLRAQKKQVDRRSGEVDSLAASLILQDYVEANQIGLVDTLDYDIDQ
ncbi:MAG: Holliday junction resolvase RuvX [Opitutales bacterium]